LASTSSATQCGPTAVAGNVSAEFAGGYLDPREFEQNWIVHNRTG